MNVCAGLCFLTATRNNPVEFCVHSDPEQSTINKTYSLVLVVKCDCAEEQMKMNDISYVIIKQEAFKE